MNHASHCSTNVTDFLILSEADVKRARSDRKKGKDKAPAAEQMVGGNSSGETWLWPTRCIDWFKEKTPAVNPPKPATTKPAAAKPRGKRVKEPVPAAESAAEPSKSSRTARRRLEDRSAEPPADNEAPMSKPSEDEATTAGPKQRPKSNTKMTEERNLRRRK